MGEFPPSGQHAPWFQVPPQLALTLLLLPLRLALAPQLVPKHSQF